MRGIYNRGLVKKTNGQKKKHCSFMTEDEKNFIVSKIRCLDMRDINMSYHALNNGVKIDLKCIKDILAKDNISGMIVEYNEQDRDGLLDRRVLLRDDISYDVEFVTAIGKTFTAKANACFVINMDSGRVVTTYFNKESDSHDTINMDRYQNDIVIIK